MENQVYVRCDCGHAISQLSEARWVCDAGEGPVALLCVDCYEAAEDYSDQCFEWDVS